MKGAVAIHREATAMYAVRMAPAYLNMGVGRIQLGRVLLRLKSISRGSAY